MLTSPSSNLLRLTYSIVRTAVRNSRRSFTTTTFSTSHYGNGCQDGKIAIITAGTDGIGLAMAKRIAQDGAHVVVSSRTNEKVDKAVTEIKAMGLKASGHVCHVGNPEERKDLITSTAEKFGGIDILVSNAGVNPYRGKFLTTPESAWDKTCDVHIKANFFLISDVVPHMAKRKTQSSILITSSMSGFVSHSYPGAYAVSKSALFSMTKAFVPELTELNIRINCLSLGLIETKFAEHIGKIPHLWEKELKPMVPMKRYGKPEECGGLAAFLCSDEASFITGENFCIAGGAYSRL